jgi:hypothetical protein
MMTAPSGGSLTGIASIDAILRLANHLPVFPCRARDEEQIVNGQPKLRKAKSPRIENGFLKATQDEGQIRAWWKRWPDALVGVPMGQTTGLIAIDYDPAKRTNDTDDWFESHADALMSGRIHGTRNAGRHYLYRVPTGQRYRSGVDLLLGGKIRRGLDLRADGGYIIWWPLHGGTAMNEAPFLPAGLMDERAFATPSHIPRPTQAPSPESWRNDRQRVVDALAYMDPVGYETWISVGMALHFATAGNDEGFDIWNGWSAGGITGNVPHNYAGLEECRYKWASFSDEGNGRVTLGTLFHEAKARGYSHQPHPPAAHVMPHPADAEPPAEAAQAEPYRRVMRWTELEQGKPADRLWRISHWLTTGPTLLAGVGGIGKTLIAQTIATALAIGKNFIDQVEESSTVLFWACEDEHDELWRRQIAICDYFGISMTELEGKLIISPRLGDENSLYTLVFGRPAWTPLRDELRDQLGDYKADTLFLDNIAQTYGANENDRHHVTSFVNGIIGLVPDRACSHVLLGHPSRGLGSEFSGSSAWENAVRMRWYMGATLPDQKQDEPAEAQDPNVRFIAKRKANYSLKDYRKLLWKDGVFVPEQQEGPISQRYSYPLRKEGAISAVLFAIRKFSEQSIRVTDGKNSPDYLPRKMRDAKLTQDYTLQELAEAMVGLRLQGRISVTKVGSYPNRTPLMGLSVHDNFAQK